MSIRRGRGLAWAATVSLLLGCGSSQGTRPAAGVAHGQARQGDYPGTLIDSTALPQGIFWRQRITATHGERELSFQAVVQTDAHVLTVLALTPHGTRAFLLQQRGTAVEYTAYVDRPLPFPPRFILLDVHRTFFLGLAPAPTSEGTHRRLRGEEWIEERWRAGRLVERSFERASGRPAGRIRVLYPGGMRDGVPPARVELHNGWFDYRLVIRTLPP